MTKKYLQKIVQRLVESSYKDGRMIESQVTKAIKTLKSLPKYEAIQALTEYLTLIKREERKHTLQIETVIPLSLTHLKKIKKIVEKKVKVTRVVTSINPEILGGFKLKIGDEIWDETILDKLNQVKEVIAHGRPDSAN